MSSVFKRVSISILLAQLVSAAGELVPSVPTGDTVFHGNAKNTVAWTGGDGKWIINLMQGNDVCVFKVFSVLN
jgi:hypothetical protein